MPAWPNSSSAARLVGAKASTSRNTSRTDATLAGFLALQPTACNRLNKCAEKFVATLFAVTLLAGCATVHEPVPQGHVGPVAIVEDSFKQLSTSKTDFFYVEQVDGRKIDNSRTRSLAANRGAGMRMTPQFEQRNIPASRATSLTIVARTEHAAPILTLTRSVYEVKGVVDFIPEPGKRYIVRGSLQTDRSSVWLEEKESQQVVSKKIEIEGSAKLGFFDK